MEPAGGTGTATVISPSNEGIDNDFVVSVRELLGNGSGAGTDSLSEHRHGPPLQQPHDPLAPQQLPCFAEDAAVPPQQECRGCDPLVQCGHFPAGAASARAGFTAIDSAGWFPQLHAITGRVSAGTSVAASHTRAFAVMLL
ncbi:MAG: hypothetical protein ACYC0X_20935 [Pirellulaceae bacterium]